MERGELRESRIILRQVEAHLRQSHIDMGAQEEMVGMVDVFHHETSSIPMLNYVTPRKNTAWISKGYVEKGIARLRDKGRQVRVRFAEGLYPPMFAKTLRELNLHVENETPIMTFKADKQIRKTPTFPQAIEFSFVTDHQSLNIWWYVWRNAYYNVMTNTVEPLVLGRDLRAMHFGHQLNLIMYRGRFPIGVARITIHEQTTAHIAAMAIMHEFKKPEYEKSLREVALDAALHEGCKMVFATGSDDATRQAYRNMGFIDSGSIVWYADNQPTDDEDETLDALAQSVLII